MKKKTLVISLLLTLALVFGSFTSVFAAEKTGTATKATKKAIKESGIQTVQKFDNEVGAESYVITFAKEVLEGKYKLISTAGVRESVKKKDAVIIDTMPEGWYKQRHIPGAVCQVVGAMKAEERFPIQEDEKVALKKLAKEKCTEYYNENTKKWQSKKPAAKYFKQKKTRVNKKKKIIVYCGFVGCARSHQGAMYLKKLGYKNVYRYPGGISAWVDGKNKIAGTDIK